MSRLTLRHFARCVPPIRQRQLLSLSSSRHLSTLPALRSAKEPPLRHVEIDRACGAPLNSTEAGPSSPGGILRPEMWIIGSGVILTIIGLYLFMPSSPSKFGQAMQKRILDQRKTVERREGDREEDETDAEKMEEAEIIRNTVREKKMNGTKPGR